MSTFYLDPKTTLGSVNLSDVQPKTPAIKPTPTKPTGSTTPAVKPTSTPAPTPTQTTPTNNSGIDYDVVALAKAIRQHETGNRQISGKTGELASRYQFMPSTWNTLSQKYLGADQSHALSLENENKVAYSYIKDMKDKGLDPGQIASIWNSGHPDPFYLGGGTGKGESSTTPGIYYDVPRYVNSVYGLYKKFKKDGQAEQAKKAQEQQTQLDIAKKPETAVFGMSDVPVEAPMSTVPEIAGTQKAMETGAGLLDVASNAVNNAFDWYNKAVDSVPFLRLIPKAVGGVVGTLGAVEGGIIGGSLEAGKELFSGDHLDGQKIWNSAYKTGAETAAAGYKMGEAGTKTAPIVYGIGEYLPAVVGQTMAGQMVYSGLKTAIKGKTVEEKTQGVMSALLGGAGLKYTEPIKGVISRDAKIKAPADLVTNVIDAYKSIANPTKSQLQKIETKGGKSLDDIYSILGQEGVMPVKDGNRLRILEPEIDKLVETKSQIDAKIATSLSKNPDVSNNLEDIRTSVIDRISKTEKNALVLQDKIKNVNDLIDAEIQKNNGNPVLSDSQMHDIKNGMWTVGYDLTNNTKASIARQIGFELKNKITANNPDLNIQNLNELSGKYADAISFAKSIDGNIVKGGKLGNWFSTMIGEKILTNMLGHVPIVGRFTSLLGSIIGKNYSEYMNDPERVITKALNELKKTPMDKQSTILMKQFDEAFKARKQPLQLPAPKAPGEPGAPTAITPPPTTYEKPAVKIGGKGQTKKPLIDLETIKKATPSH